MDQPTTVEERPGVEFDIYSPDLLGDRYWDALAELRSHGPLVWVESLGGYWAATSYELVRQMATDWESFSSATGVSVPRPAPDVQPYIMPIEKDPPRQLLFRRKVNPHLTPAAVAGLEPSIGEVADVLIDTFVERGTCDLTLEFARKFPGTVFFRLVIPEGDDTLALLEQWVRTLSFDPDPAKKGEAFQRMSEWSRGVLERHASDADAGDDIVDAILQLREDDPESNETDLVTGVGLLAQGGIGTSAQLISSIVKALCDDPALQARVRDDLELVPRLVEEVLRTEPPVTAMFRTATRDLELAGRRIRAGDKVGLFFVAANRDAEVFERPDELDIDRTTNPHVAFGLGTHRCAGSSLARLQVRIAIERLLTRLSPFQVQAGAEIRYMTASQRGPSSIPLEFTPGPRRFGGVTA
jgi:cytochrome P450